MPKKNTETRARELREANINLLVLALRVLDDRQIAAIRAIDGKLVDALVEEQFDLTRLNQTLRGLTLHQIDKLRSIKTAKPIMDAYVAGTLEPEWTDADERLRQALNTPIPRRKKQ